MGNIRPHGRGWQLIYQVAGQRHWETIHVRDRTEAIRILKIREGEALDLRKPPEVVSSPTFNELARGVETDYQINRRRTLKDLRLRLKHLRVSFGEFVASEITGERVREYIVRRQREGAASGSINRELAALKRTLNLAVQAGRLHRVPEIPRLKEASPRQGFFEPEQFLGVLNVLPDHLRPVARFAYFTGWRLSEVVSLAWSQVELNARVLRLWPGTTKNDEGRVLPLEGELWDIIERQLNERPADCPWVFYRRLKRKPQRKCAGNGQEVNGTPPNWEPLRTFYKAWREACWLAGCPGMIFHDLRRTAVRNFRRAGLSEAEAMAITGHKTREVFERYNIMPEKDVKDAMWRAQAFLAGKLAECAQSVPAASPARNPVDCQPAGKSVG